MEQALKEYPNPCVRCGFCCLSETCPAGKKIFGTDWYEPCIGLRFNGDEAECVLVVETIKSKLSLKKKAILMEMMGIGKGCCIKARAYKDGVEYDFASLPAELKYSVVRGMRKSK